MPGPLTLAAALSLVMHCGAPVPPAYLTAIMTGESSRDPAKTHTNPNKTTDYGLMQINEKNLAWLGETPTTIMEPCRNVRAAARILTGFSRYNTGSPTAGLDNGYSLAMWRRMRELEKGSSSQPTPIAAARPRRLRDQLVSLK